MRTFCSVKDGQRRSKNVKFSQTAIYFIWGFWSKRTGEDNRGQSRICFTEKLRTWVVKQGQRKSESDLFHGFFWCHCDRCAQMGTDDDLFHFEVGQTGTDTLNLSQTVICFTPSQFE